MLTSGFDVSVIHGGINILSVGDINGDGKLDVISSGDGSIQWWENPGSADVTWTRHTVYQGSWGDVRMAFAEDINSDGKLDIISSGFGNISWWENTKGDGSTWVRHVITSNDGNAQSITVGDMNGDGHPDLFSYAPMSPVATWYENDGAANPSFTPHTISFPMRPGTVSLGDLTGEGRLDAVITPVFGNSIDWFLNWDGQSPLPTSNPPAPYLPPGSGNLPPGTPMSALMDSVPPQVGSADTGSTVLFTSGTSVSNIGKSALNNSAANGVGSLVLQKGGLAENAGILGAHSQDSIGQVVGLVEATELSSLWEIAAPLSVVS
jgi:hypothetical protein